MTEKDNNPKTTVTVTTTVSTKKTESIRITTTSTPPIAQPVLPSSSNTSAPAKKVVKEPPAPPPLFPEINIPDPPLITLIDVYMLRKIRELRRRLRDSPFYVLCSQPKSEIERYSEKKLVALAKPQISSVIKLVETYYPKELQSDKPPVVKSAGRLRNKADVSTLEQQENEASSETVENEKKEREREKEKEKEREKDKDLDEDNPMDAETIEERNEPDDDIHPLMGVDDDEEYEEAEEKDEGGYI